MIRFANPMEVALWCLRQGLYPILLAYGTKKPVHDDWPNQRYTEAQIAQYFNGHGKHNIGVRLGEPAADVDVDCEEGLRAWPEYRPETRCVWGRLSMPASHHLYWSDPPIPSVKYIDPLERDKDKATLLELRCLKKDGTVGMQTMAPPSRHPSGEDVCFYDSGAIGNVEAEELRTAVARTATACLLARYFPPSKGGRNDCLLSIAGTLARAGWTAEEITTFLRAIYRCLWPNPDFAAAKNEAEATHKRHAAGHQITGYTKLCELVDKRAVDKALEWLGIQREPPRPHANETEPSVSLEFPETAWRGAFADYRAAMQGTTEASDVAHFATLWAACAVALERKVYMYSGDMVYPNVYLALFGASGDKKTTAERRILSCKLLEHSPTVRVIRGTGSTEGLADTLKEAERGVYLCLWEEFASFLARAHWSGSTLLEFLTEAFDCPEEWSATYRKNPIRLERPTPSVLTATTVEWFWKNARPEDFFGGFGNRFLFLTGAKKAPIANPVSPAGAKLHEVKKRLELLASRPACEAQWTTGAARLWKSFYEDFEGQDRKGILGAALKRLHVYVRKLVMVYAAVEATLPDILEEQLQAAIDVVRYAASCTDQLLDLQVAQYKPQGELEQRVLKWVTEHQGERLRRCQQLMWKYCGNTETFNRVFRSLELADRIEVRDRRVYLPNE